MAPYGGKRIFHLLYRLLSPFRRLWLGRQDSNLRHMPESKSGALNHFATPQYVAVQYPKTHRYLESKVLPDLEVISLILAGEVRFELTTHGLTVRCANHYATLQCGALGWIRTNDHPIIGAYIQI